jgi:hypothetical protein
MRHKLFHLHQARYSKPFLLLEIGMLHLRLHAINAGRNPISVNTLREEFLTSADMPLLLETVTKVLDTDSAIRDLAIVMNSSAIRHQILCTPHLSAAERQKILRHEMKISSAPGETQGILSHWFAGKIKQPDTTEEYALCAEMNPAVADGLIKTIQGKKFELIGFTSHAQMVSNLIKECGMDGNLNAALLEVNDREGSITLFRSNIWNMDRHFLIGSSTTPFNIQDPAGMDAEKLKLEVGRALQYFKQQVRNENINQIFLFGATDYAISIKRLLESSFRIPVTPVVLEGETFAAKNPDVNREEALPLYGIAHAAALHAHFKKYISFLPPEWHGQKHVKIRQLSLIGSAIVLYALMGGILYVLKPETAKIAALKQESIQPILQHRDTDRHTQQLQLSRSFALATERSNQWLRGRHRIVAELARELAGSVPPQMRITTMELTEKGDAWQVKLQAEIYSPSGSRSQQLFLGFQEQIRQMPCLKHLTWGDVQLSDLDSSRPANLKDLAPGNQNLLTFTMKGMLGYIPRQASSQPPKGFS